MNRSVIRATSLSLLSASFLLAACDARPTAPEAATRPAGGPTRTVDPFLMDPIVVDGCADNQCAEGGGGGGGSTTVPPDYLPPPPPPEPGAGGGPVYSPDESYGPGLWLFCTAGLLASTGGIIVTNVQIQDLYTAVYNLRAVQNEFKGKPWTQDGITRYWAAKDAVRREAYLLAATGLGTVATFIGAAQACSPGLVLPTP